MAINFRLFVSSIGDMELKIAGSTVNQDMLVVQAVELLQKKKADRLSIYINDICIDKVYYAELMDFLNEEVNGQKLYTHKLNFDLESAIIAIRNKKIEDCLKGQYNKYDRYYEAGMLNKTRIACMVSDTILLAVIAGYCVFHHIWSS